ncbi:MAG: GNAT family N-acetyltransferase [Streptosporangiaceae bacterium]
MRIGEHMSALMTQVTRRWQAADPLLPWPALPTGCGPVLIGAGPQGGLAAAGTCEHWAGEPGSLELAWGAARRFRLTACVAGPDVADGLDRLLARWRDHLAEVPGTGEPDTAAVVTWPSRDIGGIAALRRRGLTPTEVIAARPAGQASARRAEPAPVPSADGARLADVLSLDELRIRRAEPADLDVVTRLGLHVVRYDAQVSSATERLGTEAALECEAAGWLASAAPWTWLAERRGRPVGLLSAERPPSAAWIAPLTAGGPVAYVMLMFVEPGERGRGVGAALAAHFHREADASGVGVTLLHHGVLNPLSAPFWNRQGYRPLWTTWEATPARAIR